METYQEKVKELSIYLLNIDLIDKVFEQEETRQLLKIFKRRTTINYDSSCVKLTRQTEEQTEYDIHFYKDGVKLKEQRLIDLTTLHKSTFIDNFIEKHYPHLKKKPRIKKSRKKKHVDPANYLINFGKYSGRRLASLTSPEEIQYCEWMLKQLQKTSRTSKKLIAFVYHLEQIKSS